MLIWEERTGTNMDAIVASPLKWHRTPPPINMSPVKSEKKYVVSELSYFKPTEDRKVVVISLEEWAARILEPDISMILD